MSRRWVVVLFGCGRVAFDPIAGDATVPAPPRCAGAGPDTVALYRFEAGAPHIDDTGQHSGIVRGGNLPAVAGPCDGAVTFGAGHVLVADSTAFDLERGSIELFLRFTGTTGSEQGLVSRDANFTDLAGHLLIELSRNGQPFVRLQSTDGEAFRCGSPIAANTWTHLAVSFGPPGLRMWVDGVEATAADVFFFTSTNVCGADATYGMAGNRNPLLLGAGAYAGNEGDPAPPLNAMFAGDIDHVHLRSTWIDFGL